MISVGFFLVAMALEVVERVTKKSIQARESERERERERETERETETDRQTDRERVNA